MTPNALSNNYVEVHCPLSFRGSWLRAYHTYVLPHLDYCCQIWSPGAQKWIQKIEQVQKRALRMIPSLKDRSYEQKLASLNLLTLENRRVLFDLTQKSKSSLLFI